MTNTVADTADLDTQNSEPKWVALVREAFNQTKPNQTSEVLQKLDNNVGLVIIVILAILFLLGTVANTTLLMAFFRRPTLRTTSNRY